MKLLFSILVLSLTFNSLFAVDAATQEDKMVAIILMMDDDDDDQQVVATLYTTLMAAEKVAKLLDIEMNAQDEVNNDLFVFALKSEEQKNLTLKMFDEEGYELAANRTIEIQDGNNYNALNVKTLDDGTYRFLLTDEYGAEKSKTITINRSEK